MHLAVLFSSIWAEKGRNNMAISPSYRAFHFIFTGFLFSVISCLHLRSFSFI